MLLARSGMLALMAWRRRCVPGCSSPQSKRSKGYFFNPISSINRASSTSSFAISSPNSAAGMNAGRTPSFSAALRELRRSRPS